MKMRVFALSMLGLVVLGMVISVPYQVLSGVNSASTTSTSVREYVKLKASVPEEVVTNNTFTIKDLDTKNSSIIQLNTEVTKETVDVVIKKIKQINSLNKKKYIYLLLDSPGGSVFDGARLITAMENSKIPVYTVCTELCASMAAQILEHGKERYMVDRSTVMFHPASMALMIQGEVDKIYSRLGSGKRFIDKLDMYVAKRSGQSYVDFKAKTMQEYRTDAEDALRDHLIDSIVNIDFEKEIPSNNMSNDSLKLDLEN